MNYDIYNKDQPLQETIIVIYPLSLSETYDKQIFGRVCQLTKSIDNIQRAGMF